MIKYSKVLGLLILLVLAIFFLSFSRTIFQEGNPLPVASGIIKLSISGGSYAKINEHKYIVKTNDTDIKKLKDYLAQNNVVYVDQMGAGLFFKAKDGRQYIATIRMLTKYFEIWDFSNQTNQGLILP